MDDVTHYFVTALGAYIGGFCGEDALALVPDGAVEVSSAPSHASDVWDGSAWIGI